MDDDGVLEVVDGGVVVVGSAVVVVSEVVEEAWPKRTVIGVEDGR